MRVAVFTDHIFWRDGDALYSDRVFPLFVARLSTMVERLVFVARLNPSEGRSHYRLPAGTGWKRVVALKTDRYGVFTRTLRKPRRGTFRARFAGATSLPFAVKKTPNFPISPPIG